MGGPLRPYFQFILNQPLMSHIKQFDKQNLKDIRSSLTTILKVVEENYGIKISVGSIRFAGTMFKASIEANIIDGETLTPVGVPGFAPIGSKFRLNGVGQVYTVVEHKPTRRQYPIVAVLPNGTRYKFSNESATKYPVVIKTN